jgi:hypothetical protein
MKKKPKKRDRFFPIKYNLGRKLPKNRYAQRVQNY